MRVEGLFQWFEPERHPGVLATSPFSRSPSVQVVTRFLNLSSGKSSPAVTAVGNGITQ